MLGKTNYVYLQINHFILKYWLTMKSNFDIRLLQQQTRGDYES